MADRPGGMGEAISFGYFLGRGVADVVVGTIKPAIYGLSELTIGKKKR